MRHLPGPPYRSRAAALHTHPAWPRISCLVPDERGAPPHLRADDTAAGRAGQPGHGAPGGPRGNLLSGFPEVLVPTPGSACTGVAPAVAGTPRRLEVVP